MKTAKILITFLIFASHSLSAMLASKISMHRLNLIRSRSFKTVSENMRYNARYQAICKQQEWDKQKKILSRLTSKIQTTDGTDPRDSYRSYLRELAIYTAGRLSAQASYEITTDRAYINFRGNCNEQFMPLNRDILLYEMCKRIRATGNLWAVIHESYFTPRYPESLALRFKNNASEMSEEDFGDCYKIRTDLDHLIIASHEYEKLNTENFFKEFDRLYKSSEHNDYYG